MQTPADAGPLWWCSLPQGKSAGQAEPQAVKCADPGTQLPPQRGQWADDLDFPGPVPYLI